MNRQEVERIVDDRISSVVLAYLVGAGITTYGLWHIIGTSAIFVGLALLAMAVWKTTKLVRRIPARFWWSCWIVACVFGIGWVGSEATKRQHPMPAAPHVSSQVYDVSSFGRAPTSQASSSVSGEPSQTELARDARIRAMQVEADTQTQ
ncbi:hypothetical protein [Burkholderia cenocepacia]|uniref:hypothetical protein n=1 Tax=Burkholderia cenocepacia TaxID=95486 RepID=UPI00222F3762|nr:hypothetical protein [Burkholderia cenocepacia]MCW3539349.1 hypothetical protein [Burkholderia cenocepacia]